MTLKQTGGILTKEARPYLSNTLLPKHVQKNWKSTQVKADGFFVVVLFFCFLFVCFFVCLFGFLLFVCLFLLLCVCVLF